MKQTRTVNDDLAAALKQEGNEFEGLCKLILHYLDDKRARIKKLAAELRKLQRGAAGDVKNPRRLSRTALMHQERVSKGLCANCGDEPLSPVSSSLGAKCLADRATYTAKRRAK